MARIKQAKVKRLIANNQNSETIRVVIKTPLKTINHPKFYDLSSKAQLVIVGGDVKKQDDALTALRQEMAEIIRSIAIAEGEDKVPTVEMAKQYKRKRRLLSFIK